MKQKIFVNVGSTYSFDRLIKKMDTLGKYSKYSIFLQIGKTEYQPKNCKYSNFLNNSEFEKMIDWADIVVSHAGVGSIIEIVKHKKNILLFPRLKKFGEAVDDHQLEICKAFKDKYKIQWTVDANNIEKLLSCSTSIKLKNKNKLANEVKKILNETEK